MWKDWVGGGDGNWASKKKRKLKKPWWTFQMMIDMETCNNAAWRTQTIHSNPQGSLLHSHLWIIIALAMEALINMLIHLTETKHRSLRNDNVQPNDRQMIGWNKCVSVTCQQMVNLPDGSLTSSVCIFRGCCSPWLTQPWTETPMKLVRRRGVCLLSLFVKSCGIWKVIQGANNSLPSCWRYEASVGEGVRRGGRCVCRRVDRFMARPKLRYAWGSSPPSTNDLFTVGSLQAPNECFPHAFRPNAPGFECVCVRVSPCVCVCVCVCVSAKLVTMPIR